MDFVTFSERSGTPKIKKKKQKKKTLPQIAEMTFFKHSPSRTLFRSHNLQRLSNLINAAG